MTRTWIVLAACLAAASGCSSSEGRPVVSRSSDIRQVNLSRLPDLPGCNLVSSPATGPVSLAEVVDDAALYVVYLGEAPVCVDDLQGIFAAPFLTDEAIANAFDGTPLPARGSLASGDVGDGTPLPARPSIASGDVGDGTPLPALTAADVADVTAGAGNASSGTADDGTPLPARPGTGSKSGESADDENP